MKEMKYIILGFIIIGLSIIGSIVIMNGLISMFGDVPADGFIYFMLVMFLCLCGGGIVSLFAKK